MQPPYPARMEKQPANGILEDFRIQFLDCWQRLPNKGLFFVLLVAWLSLFHFLGNSTLGYIPTPSLLSWMRAAYSSTGDAGRQRRQPRQVNSLRGLGAILVETQAVAGPAAPDLAAGDAGGGAGPGAAFAGIHGPATAHLDRRAVRRHLRFDGPGVGTPNGCARASSRSACSRSACRWGGPRCPSPFPCGCWSAGRWS